MNINFKNLKPTTPPHRRAGYNLKPRRGFTLVEMLVSVSVFMVVMLVAASSLLSIIDGNNKAQSLKSAINNLNFTLESMQKNIRVGTNYQGGTGYCPSGDDDCVSFTSYKDSAADGKDFMVYRFNNQSIERCVKPNDTYTISNCSINDYVRLTAPEVEITSMKFYVNSGSQPRVLLTISGKAGSKEKIKTSFNLQTTVSQRAF